jgi:group I intron endonuclease
MSRRNPVVYCIANTVTWKLYVGSSIYFEKRMSAHWNDLKNCKHHNKQLQIDYNIYGKHSFEVVILERPNVENILIAEQKWMDLNHNPYNETLDASAPMTGRRHKSSTIEKFKKRKVRKGKDHHFFDKKLSPEHVTKLRLSRIGTKRSLETRSKMRETALRIDSYSRMAGKRARPILDNTGNEFRSLKSAAMHWNIHTSTVCDILKGRHSKTRKGISFVYKS